MVLCSVVRLCVCIPRAVYSSVFCFIVLSIFLSFYYHYITVNKDFYIYMSLIQQSCHKLLFKVAGIQFIIKTNYPLFLDT